MPPELERCVEKIVKSGRINKRTGKPYTEAEAWAICRASTGLTGDFEIDLLLDCGCGKHLAHYGDLAIPQLDGVDVSPCEEQLDTFDLLKLDAKGNWVIKRNQ